MHTQARELTLSAADYQGTDVNANSMVLITVLLCTLVRGAKLQEAKVGRRHAFFDEKCRCISGVLPAKFQE